MTREQYKSLSLVALFGLCTILVSQILSGISMDRLKPMVDFTSSVYATEQITDLIYPQSYVMNFGGGSHTAMYTDVYSIWDAVRPGVISVMRDRISENAITPEEWQDRNRFRSVRFDLPVALTPDQLLKLYSVEGAYTGKVGAIDTLLLSAAEPETLYVGNTATRQYFTLVGKAVDIGVEVLLQQVEAQNEPEYETIEDRYRIRAILQQDPAQPFTANTVMVPRFEIKPKPILRVRGELPVFTGSEEAKEAVRTLADAAFGNAFAFVNRLVDVNGAVVFLYGYGEKAFRIHPNGMMDYQEKPDPILINKKTDLPGALRRAVAFIDRVGGIPEGLSLTGYQATENKLGYRFTFGYPVEGLPVVSTVALADQETPRAYAPIEIEIQGEQTVYCQRQISHVEALLDVTPLWDRVLSLDEIIVKNYERLLPLYISRSGDSSVDTSIQYRLLQSIRAVRLVYCQNTAGDRMTPAWEINISGAVVYINIYDGRILAQMH